jgi:hypothetical protein
VADRPTASDTLRVMGVELWRESTQGGPSAIHMMFAVVQTDWTWMAWYFFSDDVAGSLDFVVKWKIGARVASIYGQGFGRTNDEYRTEYLHLTKPVRVDDLVGDNPVPAVMFARNSPKKDAVLVDIDIQFKNRNHELLQLRRLPMDGLIEKKFDGKRTRGTVNRLGPVKIYDKKEFKDPPWGSSKNMTLPHVTIP